MRPGIKRGECCRDNVSRHPIIVVSVIPVDPSYYARFEELVRHRLNTYKKFKVYGISLVDGSLKTFYTSKNSPLRKYTTAEAYLARRKIREQIRERKQQ